MTTTPFEVLLARRFESFEELASLAVAWDADFRQLDASRLPNAVLQAQVDGVLVSLGRFGCHVDQRGATPGKMRTFAFSAEGCPEMSWFGHRAGPDMLLAFPTHGEIAAVSRPGFSEFTFSVHTDALATFFDRNGGPALDEVLTPNETLLPVPPRLLNALRHHLRQVSAAANDPKRSSRLVAGFRYRLFSLLLEIFRSSDGRRTEPIPQRNRRLLEVAAAMVDDQGDSPLALADLCAAGQISERTLLNTFRREYGMTPKAYLKAHRLFKVHRDLWHTSPNKSRVSDVANAWGFWHLGQFAADYRRQFGELPSETLRRTR
jgi:AraC-like DNA-binding protein